MMAYTANYNSPSKPIGLALAAFAAIICCGCAADANSGKLASWNPANVVGWTKGDKRPEPKVPTRLVATWTETVLNKAGETPKRGFGGRIAFFTRESENPVHVDGQLVVYAFDETARQPHETQPTRKFIFPAEEVVRHESESAVGPSYSFWLPWDDVGGPQKHISLIARFEPQGGPIVIGEQTKHFLPGATPEASAPNLAQPSRTDVLNGIRLANYSQLAGASQAPDLGAAPLSQAGETSVLVKSRQMSTETIELPERLASTMQTSARLQQHATTIDSEAAATMPLAQLSKMKESGPLASVEQIQPLQQPQAAPSKPTQEQPPSRSIAAGGPAAPGSLRDSLLGTLPARARQAGRQAPDRAR
jgi:hypothetical protein